MININLLPEELRPRTKKNGFDPDYILYCIPLAFAVLIVVHLFLLLNLGIKGQRLASLNNKWKALAPQVKALDDLKKESGGFYADNQLGKLVSDRVDWAQKLYSLSADLPDGVWFTSLSLSAGGLSLKGTVISLQKEEMDLINAFMSRLKQDKRFFNDFKSFELSSAQKREIGSYGVVDFVITGTLKNYEKK